MLWGRMMAVKMDVILVASTVVCLVETKVVSMAAVLVVMKGVSDATTAVH